MPNRAASTQHTVAGLAHDRLGTFEYGITAEIFGQNRPEMGSDWYRFLTVAATPGPLRALGGLTFEPEFGLEVLELADTIVVPGWTGVDVPVPAELIAALRRAHTRGARLVSICSGAFVLAAAGLLDGLTVTTHWRYAEALASRYPAIRVDPNVLYVDNAPIFTSAGSAAGIDLLLHLVRLDHGPEKANSVARRMVMAPHRQGGQAQFIERPMPAGPHGRLTSLLDRLRGDLGRRYRLSELASLVGMSERTFIRRFRDTTGMSPGEWLVRTRVDFAKEQLEATSSSVDQIAQVSGFATVEALRHHFRRRIGLSPREYRQRFACREVAPRARAEA
ncbi:MAG TPA: transcriptional regulator FtrA [Sphingomicrobium sp.]|nr:transcriptional regulator FtrA [Sphingomicrobium sp.]